MSKILKLENINYSYIDGGYERVILNDLSAEFEEGKFVVAPVEVKEILGDAVKYDKKERSLVLEFKSIQDAVRALDILPFGIDYKIFLLNL